MPVTLSPSRRESSRADVGNRVLARGSGAPEVVAVVTDALYPYHMGGKEIRYHHVIKGLHEQGLEVHVFTMRWWDGPKHRIDEGVHYHALCRRYALYRKRRRSILQAVMFSLACLRLLVHRYELIEADHMPHLQLFTIRLVASLRRVPLVVTWHEVWGRAYWKSYLGAAGTLAAWIEQRSMRLGDAIVAPSPGTVERLVAHGIKKERLTLAPNGLDLVSIAAAAPSALALDVLYVGRLVHHKRVDALLEALALLEADGRMVTCGIVGQGPERDSLEELAAGLGLESRVRFLGNVDDQSQVFGLMKAARVFALPSTREGFGLVVAEAIACGLPVVTSNHPDNHAREFVEEGVTGWCCDATGTSIAQGLRAALDLPGIDPLALERVTGQYSWQASVAAILDTFTRLAHRRVNQP